MNDFIIKGEELLRYVGNEAKVIVPDNVSVINTSAFEDRNIAIAVLPEGLKKIGERAFSGCRKLEKINIPNTTEKIGPYAFAGCEKLESIFVPNNTEIGDDAFSRCEMLAKMQDMVIVNNELFDCYSEDENVIVPAGVTKIHGGAFKHLPGKVYSIYLPETVKHIESLEISPVSADGTTISAPPFSYANNWAKKYGYAGIKSFRRKIRKTKIKRQLRKEAELAEEHAAIVEKYRIKEKIIDEGISELYTDAPVPLQYNTPFYDSYLLSFSLSKSISELMDAAEEKKGKALLLIGDTKKGKTHLLNLLNASLSAIYPEKKILFSESENVISDVRERLERGEHPIEKVFENDIVILDDCLFEKDNRISKATYSFITRYFCEHDGISILAFKNDNLEDLESIELFMNEMGAENKPVDVAVYILTEPDENCRHLLAKEYASKNGLVIPEEELDRIAAKAESVAEVKEILTSMC